jgi:hypothetical protein
MSALDMLQTIGGAAPGTRMIAVETFTSSGVEVPEGTEIEVRRRFEADMSPGFPAFAAIDGKLKEVYISPEVFHCLKLVSEWRA